MVMMLGSRSTESHRGGWMARKGKLKYKTEHDEGYVGSGGQGWRRRRGTLPEGEKQEEEDDEKRWGKERRQDIICLRD